ncbi:MULTISPECIES: hypothetical protein [unclassified Mycoplasma]|uniref:hypothetical protein n=1 Tax=unclassified Mycoplasma TaxID=2683645 RepID=UPI00216AC0E5|nr:MULTISPECIES: hypothetical protein [unclassified Mycoplasma]MCS4536720.1 hypothetical protein [Mycoplasma sp. CSL7475-4]MCT4469744.1 hypothetical protein [Mycoplasma sp. HS2188]
MKNIIELVKNLYLSQSEIEYLSVKNQGKEIFQQIFNDEQHKIEIIHSFNAKTSWMQNENIELVALLKGQATIMDADEKLHNIQEGDIIKIEPLTKHKVTQTSQYALWLAIHLGENNGKS